MNLIICDIDGVLADCSHRLHYLEEKNYDKFYSADEILNDKVIEQGEKFVRHLIAARDVTTVRNDTCLLTGRPERTREYTKAWFALKHIYPSPECYPMYMRTDGDYRPSDVVKVEQLDKLLEEKYFESNYNLSEKEVAKIRRKSLEKKRQLYTERYDLIVFVDDDPKNVKAICEAFPQIVGITFGIKRMEEK